MSGWANDSLEKRTQVWNHCRVVLMPSARVITKENTLACCPPHGQRRRLGLKMDLYLGMSGCFVCMCVCVLCPCLVPLKVRRGCQIPWNWSYRQLWAASWVLGSEPRSSARAASALLCWAIYPATFSLFCGWGQHSIHLPTWSFSLSLLFLGCFVL